MRELYSDRSSRRRLAVVAGLLLMAVPSAGPPLAQAGDPGPAAAIPPPKDPPPEAERTDSGLASLRLAPGEGTYHPDGNDLVMVHFTGWTPDGTQFQSSYDVGEPQTFNLATVFAGWREGIGLMVTGEKRRLWIPAHLAAKNPQTGPAGAVIFDVELVSVLPLPNLPGDLRKPPADATRTPSGAFTKMVAAGEGGRRPTASESALLHYTGWTTNGRIFDSSYQRGRPTFFLLNRVLPAFSDCVMRMSEGEKRFCWIPGNIANRQWQGSPKGMLIFEIELVRVIDAGAIQAKPPEGGGASR